MAMEKKAQQANALMTKYCALWKEKYGKAKVINRHKMKWAMMDFIESVEYDRAESILAYYFRTARPGHPLEWLMYNFEDLLDTMEKRAKDDEDRAKARELTKRRVEEWKERNEQLRSKTD